MLFELTTPVTQFHANIFLINLLFLLISMYYVKSAINVSIFPVCSYDSSFSYLDYQTIYEHIHNF